MGRIARNWRVLVATTGAVILVGGSYWISHSVGTPPQAQASEETALLQQIATKDSNGDGVPDWEKQLYGIPLNATTTDYFHLGMTDAQAIAKGLIVPKAVADLPAATSTSAVAAPLVDSSLPPAPAAGTLTDAFAKSFFTLYLAAKQQNGGANLTQVQTQQIAQQAMAQFAAGISAAPDFKTLQDLATASNTADALRAYATAAGTVFATNTANASTSEIVYLRQAVQDPANDAVPLAHIASIAKLYRQTAVGLATLPVPTSLAPYDLAIINAFARLSGILSDFTKVDTDPMAAMLAIQQYPAAIQQLGDGLIGINKVYITANVSFPQGDPGAAFVNIIPSIAASQSGQSAVSPK